MLDTGAEGVRLACIKFVQRIIMVQTPGASDPRVSTVLTPLCRVPLLDAIDEDGKIMHVLTYESTSALINLRHP